MSTYVQTKMGGVPKLLTLFAPHHLQKLVLDGRELVKGADYVQPYPFAVEFTETPDPRAILEIYMHSGREIAEDGVERSWPKMRNVEPSDGADIPIGSPDGLFVVKGGQVSGVTIDGEDVTVPADEGTLICDVRFRRIHKRGTTAQVVGLWAVTKPGHITLAQASR